MTQSEGALVPKSLLGHSSKSRGMLAGQGPKGHVCWTMEPALGARGQTGDGAGDRVVAQTYRVPNGIFLGRTDPHSEVITCPQSVNKK